MPKLCRREFLKLTACTIGALTLDARTLSDVNASALASSAVEKYSFCGMCSWKCGIQGRLVDGRLMKIDGHLENPLSRGKLCARGQAGIAQLYDPDRLKKPLIRTGERGDGRYREASWEEALDYAAQGLQRISVQHGPQSVAWLGGNGAGNRWFTNYLPTAWGSPNGGTAAGSLCLGPRDVAADYTFGHAIAGHEPVDWEHNRFIVLIGTHIGENAHNTLIQDFTIARDNGAKVAVVDPRHSTAAAKADYWLPIKPGTDTALLLAWSNVLVNEGLYDRDYIEKYTSGFDALREHVQSYTPEWAASICDLSAATIREVVREMAHHLPQALIFPGRHVVWYGNDTQRMRAVYLVNTLLGSHGRPGGTFLTKSPWIKDYPGVPAGGEGCSGGGGETDVARADGVGEKFHTGPLAIQELFDTMISSNPYPLKGLVAYGINLFQSIPKVQRTKRALKELDFYMAIDMLPQEHVMWADVILPECSYLERYDELLTVSHKTPFISLRQPLVEPMWSSKPGWWIARELGIRIGVADYFPWETIEDYLDYRLKSVRSSLEEMKQKGVIVQKGKPYLDENYDPQTNTPFHTPTGKIELYSQRLADAGFDPLPTYEAVDEAPRGFLRLLYGRAPVHSFARSQNNEWLAEHMPENEVWVNAQLAAELGFEHGEYVLLENQDGVRSTPIKLKATQRIRSDCVYMVHGFGLNAPQMRIANGRGASDAALQTRYKLDPISGGAGLNVNFVKILREGVA